MKHIGQLLKNHIESHHLVKKEIAAQVGITYNYLSTIFTKKTIDLELFEKLCIATGLNPHNAFDCPGMASKSFSDISAHTNIGDASVQIGQHASVMKQLLDEKDRIIDGKDKLLEEKDKLISEKERLIKFLTESRK